MGFDLTEQQELLRKTVAGFIKKECHREYVRQLDEEEKFPHELWQKLADLYEFSSWKN